ncbi:zinc finger protein 813-like [Cloeon dipterum]|uniref:zinc finger protein 813-like n=1 Tax=Cloeon dipterum TaxID=197152 RepID=UPI003220785C
MDISTASCVWYESKCLLCSMVFPNLRALRGHAKDHTQTSPPYRCHICPFFSNNKIALQRHNRTHKGDQPYKCGLCNDLFSSKYNRKRHLLKIHAITSEEQVLSLLFENQQTPDCEENWTPAAAEATAEKDQEEVMQHFSAKLSIIALASLSIGVPPIWNAEPFLKKYQLLASGADLATNEDSPLDLTVKSRDEKTVTRNESTTYSEEDHEDCNGSAAFFVETIYNSPEEEGEKFKRAKTNESAYARAPNRVDCPVCKATFPWSSSLKRHMLVHTGEKPFRCHENVKSSPKDSLFKCDICSKKSKLQFRED